MHDMMTAVIAETDLADKQRHLHAVCSHLRLLRRLVQEGDDMVSIFHVVGRLTEDDLPELEKYEKVPV